MERERVSTTKKDNGSAAGEKKRKLDKGQLDTLLQAIKSGDLETGKGLAKPSLTPPQNRSKYWGKAHLLKYNATILLCIP